MSGERGGERGGNRGGNRGRGAPPKGGTGSGGGQGSPRAGGGKDAGKSAGKSAAGRSAGKQTVPGRSAAAERKEAARQRAEKGRPKWSKPQESAGPVGSDDVERGAPRGTSRSEPRGASRGEPRGEPRDVGSPSPRPAPRHAPRVQAPITDAGRSVRVSRIFHVPASAIFRAINDLDKRGWAPDPLYKVVSVLAPRFIRLAFPDGSLVGIAVMRQGNARCTVSVEHSRIPDGASDAQVRDRWTVALAALAEQIDTGWD